MFTEKYEWFCLKEKIRKNYLSVKTKTDYILKKKMKYKYVLNVYKKKSKIHQAIIIYVMR